MTAPSPIPIAEGFEETVRRDLLIGRQVGEYLIRRRIGSGGMGIVYEGVQPLIGRKVAVKIVRPDVVAGTGAARALLEEARLANLVRHRGLIDVFGFGELPEVGPYLVMDFLEGQSLSQRLERQRLIEPSEVVEILVGVAEALAAAHAANVIHRDLKPSNIFLVQESAGQRYPKILDFGLAKRSVVPAGLTGHHLSAVVGTPEYMSPEQVRGESTRPQSDLYSLGVTAFEALTGRLPFIGQSTLDILRQHLSAPPPPPSRFAEIPAALDSLVLQLLEKEPARRPSSARVLSAELKRVSRELSMHATYIGTRRPGEALGSLPRPATFEPGASHAKWFALAAAAGLAVGAGLWWGLSPPRARHPSPVAVAPREARPAPAPELAPSPPPVAAEMPHQTPPALAPPRPLPRPHRAASTPAAKPPPAAALAAPVGTVPESKPEPTETGWLRLSISGEGTATVVIDGEKKGEIPIALKFELKAGTHRLQVLRHQHPLIDRQIDIEPGKTRDEAVAFGKPDL